MTATAKAFRPLSATSFAHLFENPNVGLERGLFCSVTVNFVPISVDDFTFDPSFTADWLVPETFALFHEGQFSADGEACPDAEATCYYEFEHRWCPRWEIGLETRAGQRMLSYRFGIEGLSLPDYPIEGTLPLTFEGIAVVKSNFTPQPDSETKARTALAPFADLPPDWVCADEGFRFLFLPPATT